MVALFGVVEGHRGDPALLPRIESSLPATFLRGHLFTHRMGHVTLLLGDDREQCSLQFSLAAVFGNFNLAVLRRVRAVQVPAIEKATLDVAARKLTIELLILQVKFFGFIEELSDERNGLLI